MSPAQFRAKLAAIGVTQVGAAKLMGIDARTVRRYASGELPVTQLVVLALEGLLSIKREMGKL